MKNLKYFIIGFVVLDIIIIVVIMLFLFGSQKDRCLDNGGMWYRDTCITEDSSKEKLKKIGLLEEVKSDSRGIKVNYPLEVLNYPKIFNNLKGKVQQTKKDWGFDNLDVVSSNPWQLSIDIDNFIITEDVASVFGKVFTYTGGAHPNHSFITLNFNIETEDIIDLDYLFDNESVALQVISKYVIDHLHKQKAKRFGEQISNDEWIKGASAVDDNFKDFIFISSEQKNNSAGLGFIFSPYTVGSYAEGTYVVFVPSNIFYKYLKEESKSYFSINSKPDQSLLKEISN